MTELEHAVILARLCPEAVAAKWPVRKVGEEWCGYSTDERLVVFSEYGNTRVCSRAVGHTGPHIAYSGTATKKLRALLK